VRGDHNAPAALP